MKNRLTRFERVAAALVFAASLISLSSPPPPAVEAGGSASSSSASSLRPISCAELLPTIQDGRRVILRRAIRRLAQGSHGRSLRLVHATPRENRRLVRCLARAYGLDPDKVVAVPECESGNNVLLDDGTYRTAWSDVKESVAGWLAQYGHRGADWRNAYAQDDMNIRLALDQGWGKFPTCARRAGLL